MTSLTAYATHSNNWWAVEVPAVDGLFTQARRLDQIPDMVVDAVHVLDEVNCDEVTVNVVVLGDEEEIAASAREAIAEAEAARRHARQRQLDAAQRLSAEGLPQRDIGALLGVSYQYVQRLLSQKAAS